MGWLSAKNVLATLTAPFTAGTSLLFTEDDKGYSALDYLRGKKDIDEQNQFNAQQAQIQRNWQENLSNTALQRARTDAEAAGYNPVLGLSNPASTPSGATATSAGIPQSPMQMATEAATSASNLMNTMADVSLKSKQAGKTVAETDNIETQTRWMPRLNKAKIELDNATTDLQRENIIKTQAQTMAIDFENKMKSMDVKKRTNQYDKELETYKEQMTKALVDADYDNTTIGRIIQSIGHTVNAVSPFTEFTGKSNSARGQYNYTHVDYNTQ